MNQKNTFENEEIIKKNILFQYSTESNCSLRNVLIFVRDLLFYEENFKKLTFPSNNYIISDTRTANIDEYIKNIEMFLNQKKYKALLIDRQEAKTKIIKIKKNITIIIYLAKFIFQSIRLTNKELIYYIFKYFLFKNEKLLFKNFGNSRVIVFYEKSLLSMILYESSEKFEVIQHGVPTHTYWPSLAQKYYIWGEIFKKFIPDSFIGEIKILGYPGKINNCALSKKKYDILFFSQIGSSLILKQNCDMVREYINFLSNKYRIIVKLHPREINNYNLYSNKITIANQNANIDELIDISHTVCSYYSTALLIAANKNSRVFRILPDDTNNLDPLIFLNNLIPKILISNRDTNPTSIAKNIGPLFEKINCNVLFK